MFVGAFSVIVFQVLKLPLIPGPNAEGRHGMAW